jgi:hypothetical protein
MMRRIRCALLLAASQQPRLASNWSMTLQKINNKMYLYLGSCLRATSSIDAPPNPAAAEQHLHILCSYMFFSCHHMQTSN